MRLQQGLEQVMEFGPDTCDLIARDVLITAYKMNVKSIDELEAKGTENLEEFELEDLLYNRTLDTSLKHVISYFTVEGERPWKE